MAILGIERVYYRVADLDLCVRFFEDYGLELYDRSPDVAEFHLPDNSRVLLSRSPVNLPPGSELVGDGIYDTVWGVDTQEHLERLVRRVSVDREVRCDADGIHHFIADGGLPMGLKHWHERRAVSTSVDPVNSPGNINRLNVHRKWITRARPKYIAHVVFAVPEYQACFSFLRERLGFRLSDRQRGVGIFARCDGSNEHHNVYLLNASSGVPGADGTLRFQHVNFVLTDLDEMMIGKNYMERRGWPQSRWGLGRHRIASALFFYLPFPGGGEVEYGADSDALDDDWVPRDFEVVFGFAHWVHDMPEFWLEPAAWTVAFDESAVPSRGKAVKRDVPAPITAAVP